MATTTRVRVSPVLIRWARESAGMDMPGAARKLQVKPKALRQWEAAEARLTPRQLEKLADVYKRPLAAFFLPKPPVEPALPKDFRLLPEGERGELTSSTLFAARRAMRLQRVFKELVETTGAVPPRLPLRARLTDPPEEVASTARALIGIDVPEQASWKEPRIALRQWRRAVERAGALVFQFSISPNEVRGFSLPGDVPVIVLSSKDAYTGRVFTLFHELAHLILNEPGICIPEEGSNATRPRSTDGVEAFCNAFAGNFLVPSDALIQERVAASSKDRSAIAALLTRLSQKFAVSRYVILRRLLAARAISREDYRRTVAHWSRLFGKPAEAKKSSGGPSPPVRAVSELGPTFVGKVLDALDRGLVDYSQAAEHLSIRLKHLERVHDLAASQE
jgi:Zn-dependent peptidase ImmA (M78 family)